jgi:hypothetical protein
MAVCIIVVVALVAIGIAWHLTNRYGDRLIDLGVGSYIPPRLDLRFRSRARRPPEAS